MKIKTKIFRVFKNGRFQFRSTKLIVFALMVMASVGCKTVNVVNNTAPTPKQSDGVPTGTIAFSPQWRYDTLGNVWMYHVPSNKYYKMTLTQ